MMRYVFLDEVVSLDLAPPSRIEVAKTFQAGDDLLSGPAGPERVPDSLLIELGAMTAGHLIFKVLENKYLPLLLKVNDWRVTGEARAGQRLRSRARLSGIAEISEGARVAEATVEVDGPAGLTGGGQIVYVCVALADVGWAAGGGLA